MNKGEMVWHADFNDTPYWGPILSTGGNLIFTGGTADRMFRAFNADDRRKAVGVPDQFRDHRRRPHPSRWTASSTSPCSQAGASTQSA